METIENKKEPEIEIVTEIEIVVPKKNYWKKLGPGLTTGAADDDPSGIATYSQVGSHYGFQLLWLSLFTAPLMFVVQEMCARLGMVTGRGLASNIRANYSRWVLYVCVFLLFVANVFNIGADLGAMAKGFQLLFPNTQFAILVVVFALVSLLLQIYIPYKKYAPYLKYLTFSLLSYIIVGFLVHLNWSEVLWATIIPSIDFSKDQIFLICAVLGTTISPYLFFWQSSQEVEEEIVLGRTSIVKRRGVTKDELKEMRVDSSIGMVFSNLVMFFIIAVCATTLYSSGITNITTAEEAALALKPLAGDWAFALFAFGIFGTGFLAIPILAGSASYAISESFKWKEGLSRKFNQARSFYLVIILAVLVGLAFNFMGIHPIKILLYSAVLNGLVAPVILILIVSMSSNKRIMGENANGPILKIVGWVTTSLMFLVGSATIVLLIM